jgi:hypothetical protein
LHAHTLATGGTKATPIVELTRHAIRSWRSLAALGTGRRPGSDTDRSAQFPAMGFNRSEPIAQPHLPVQDAKLPDAIIRSCSHVDTHA